MGRVLIVDDEPGIREAIETLIEGLGHRALAVSGLQPAIDALKRDHFDLVITDLRLSSTDDGTDVLKAARALDPPPEVIVMTAYGTREKAQSAVATGASFYLEKGPHLASDIRVLSSHAITKRALQAENERLRGKLLRSQGVGGIIGRSQAMREVLDLIERVGPLQVTALISGESGTGKERVARALHSVSRRRDEPFVPINCGAVPDSLIESELFGHTKGAFTGADASKPGLFEAASGGTIFLDEIGELPLPLQPKLLRVLQEHTIKKVGAVDETPIDVRVVAATNRDLEAEAEAGRFREDLFFRLNVVQIDLPPLRQRAEDIPLLARSFLEKYAAAFDRTVTDIAPEAMKRLLDFDFPGNVRQLENIVERGVALARGSTITEEVLPREVRQVESRPTPVLEVTDDVQLPDEGVDLERLLADFERRLIREALRKSDGVKTRAAELLGVSFRQFRYKLSKMDANKETS